MLILCISRLYDEPFVLIHVMDKPAVFYPSIDITSFEKFQIFSRAVADIQ